jgi:precorrin-3B C17-methyltransferase
MTHSFRKELINMPKGKVSVVGTGPGPVEFLTARAAAAIEESDLVIGYKLYVNQMASLLEDSEKEVISSAMGREVDRCRRAVAEAQKGRKVALISGGDPGIYGMAGLLLQVAQEEETPPEVEIIPGVTAAGAAAAVLGAPLTHDFAVISLSDLLTPWEMIEKRLRAAAEADFVIVIYNPRSHGRSDLLARAREIIMDYRAKENAVGMVRGAGRDGEKTWATNLGDFTCCIDEADMATLVIIGNSKTYWHKGKMITPRGYEI